MTRTIVEASSRNSSAASDTTAVILVAGRAQRLAPLTDRTHKALLPVGGRPILAWMLEALHAAGVRRSVLVVGHCADRVRAEAARAPEGMAIEFVHNPDYAKGSALSLYAARDVLRGPTLIMDADVVFPREFLFRLLRSAEPNAFLIDEEFQDTGEEVKIYVQDGRVIALGKKVVPDGLGPGGRGHRLLEVRAGGGAGARHAPRARDRRERRGLGVRGRPAPAGRASSGWPRSVSGDCRGPRSTSRWTSHRARTDVFPRIARLDDPGAR